MPITSNGGWNPLIKMKSITLLELNRKIADVVNSTFDEYIWVVAEISEIRTAANGHCYLELIEKSNRTKSIVARIRATIWNNRWLIIKDSFERTTNQPISAGLKILVCAQIQMHEAYGLSLNIVDIDSSFTLGEMAIRRKEIIARLTEEGIIDMNKELDMPILPQRIAIISAENAAGYGDFCHQLANNDFGLKFYTHLFRASMQGDKTENTIIDALNRIYDNYEKFDVVVIIRGGGGVADLSSFDSYDLAVNIANFPLPVIVGIGHERDNTVIDIVAHTSVKTPTAAAAYLISILENELNNIEYLKQTLIDTANKKREILSSQISKIISDIKSTHIKINAQINGISVLKEKVKLFSRNRMDVEKNKLSYIDKTTEICRPENILNRGFSITRANGHAIKDVDNIEIGSNIEIQLAKGSIMTKAISRK